MSYPHIPNIVKHCCVAIFRKGEISAKSEKDRFLQCLKIAKSRLQQYGFVVSMGEEPEAAIGLTPKGRAAEMKHKREGRSKSLFFDTLFVKHDVDGARERATYKQLERSTEAILDKKDALHNAAVDAAEKKAAQTAPAKKKKT